MAAVVNAVNLIFCLALGALTGFVAMLDYSREGPDDFMLPTVVLVVPFAISGTSSALALFRLFGSAGRNLVIALGLAACFVSLVVLVSQAIWLGAPTAYFVGLAFWFLIVLLANAAGRNAVRR